MDDAPKISADAIPIESGSCRPAIPPEQQRRRIRLLLATAESCPTFRADVDVLFGKYLPQYGIASDIVAARATQPARAGSGWGGGEACLCDVSGGPAKRHLKILFHHVRQLLKADVQRYHAIQVRDLPLPAVIALVAARMKRLPFFYWMSFLLPESQIRMAREWGLSAGLSRFVFRWVRGRIGRFLLYRIVLPRADHVFVQSEKMRDHVASHGVDRSKMTPVPMAVDLDVADPQKVSPAPDPRLTGRRVIVHLGTLDHGREIERLFDMLAIVRRQVPDILLVLVGDTEDRNYRASLEARAMNVGVADAVIWTGWLPMRAGWGYVRAAEVGLSPIPRGALLDVGTPTKVLEYLALGTPVVGNDNPDQAAVIRESGAGLCVPYTAQEFAGAVMTLLALEPQTRSAMSRSGLRYVARHRDYRRLADGLAHQYGGLVQARSCDQIPRASRS